MGPLSRGLASWWPFSPSTASSPPDAHGQRTLSGFFTPGDWAEPGLIGSGGKTRVTPTVGYRFDNSGLYGGSWQLSVWDKYSDGHRDHVICRNEQDWVLRWQFNQIRFVLPHTNGATFVGLSDSQYVGDGNWNHYAVWYDSSKHEIGLSYCGGEPVTKSVPATPVIEPGTTTLGIGVNGSFRKDGTVDESAIWTRVLTAAERAAIYNGGLGLSYEEAMAWRDGPLITSPGSAPHIFADSRLIKSPGGI